MTRASVFKDTRRAPVDNVRIDKTNFALDMLTPDEVLIR